MALTVTPDGPPRVQGNRKVVDAVIAFDSSYPTGGESITAEQVGLSEILEIVPTFAEGRTVTYDRGTGKLLVWQGDNDAGADGPAVQVANTTDLSALDTVRIRAEGY